MLHFISEVLQWLAIFLLLSSVRHLGKSSDHLAESVKHLSDAFQNISGAFQNILDCLKR